MTGLLVDSSVVTLSIVAFARHDMLRLLYWAHYYFYSLLRERVSRYDTNRIILAGHNFFWLMGCQHYCYMTALSSFHNIGGGSVLDQGRQEARRIHTRITCACPHRRSIDDRPTDRPTVTLLLRSLIFDHSSFSLRLRTFLCSCCFNFSISVRWGVPCNFA